MTFPGLFSGDKIRELLLEVASDMSPDLPQSSIVIVGGSLLACHGLRDATQDVDSSTLIDASVQASARVVAERHGLAPTWLNDSARAWHPQTLRREDCDVLMDHPRLKVLGASLAAVFLMKLNRGQPQDVSDMITLWPLVASEFPTARVAVETFYEAFPNERIDEFLDGLVVNVARRAGQDLPLD